jgi:adenosylcobinamide-GDP ribazoletransferase
MGSALSFLTILPVPRHTAGLDRRTARWFPLVGLLIGALLAGLSLLLAWLFPSTVAAVLVVAAWATITGGLHLDGLADCGDGLLPPVSRERRLEIMRDPRVGAFGVTVLLLVLLLKAAALAALPTMWPALLAAPLWARWLILIAMRRPSARPEGMGAAQQLRLSAAQLALLALLPVAATAVAGMWHWQLWPGTAATIVATMGLLRFAEQRLGGVTGDVFGAVVEVSEAVFLCMACIGIWNVPA